MDRTRDRPSYRPDGEIILMQSYLNFAKPRDVVIDRKVLIPQMHHIIPGSTLRSFWDHALTRDQSTRELMVDFIAELAAYAVSGVRYMKNAPEGLHHFIQQLKNEHALTISSPTWKALTTKQQEDRLTDYNLKGKYLRALFYHMPLNLVWGAKTLVLGQSRRCTDPGAALDVELKPIVDSKHANDRNNRGHFDKLREINRKMEANEISGAITALKGLLNKNKMAEPYGLPFVDNWAYDASKNCFKVKNAASRGSA